MVGYLGAFVSKNGNIREIICPVVEEREDRVLQKRCQLCDFQRFLKCELTGQKIAIREFCPLALVGQAVSEKKIFEIVDGRTDDGRQTTDGRRIMAIL